MALKVVYAMCSGAARFGVAIWTEWAPSELSPADLPSSVLGLSAEAEPEEALLSVAEINDFRDLFWMLQQKSLREASKSFPHCLPAYNRQASCKLKEMPAR